jgi:hypothetical protein
MKSNLATFVVPVSTGGKIITLRGNMFNYRTSSGLFLSSNKFDGRESYYDLYSGVKSVSANNRPFSAYPVDEFNVYNNHTLSFKLSSFNKPQNIDIIFANPAGYNLASSGKKFTFIQIISGN